jgi:hypothetical protein
VADLVCDYIPNKKYRSENFSFYVTVFRIIWFVVFLIHTP